MSRSLDQILSNFPSTKTKESRTNRKVIIPYSEFPQTLLLNRLKVVIKTYSKTSNKMHNKSDKPILYSQIRVIDKGMILREVIQNIPPRVRIFSLLGVHWISLVFVV